MPGDATPELARDAQHAVRGARSIPERSAAPAGSPLPPASSCRSGRAGGPSGPGAARCPPAPRPCLLPHWPGDAWECVTARGSLSGVPGCPSSGCAGVGRSSATSSRP
jgi:hypothetical protein